MSTDPDNVDTSDTENRFDRLDRKVGMAWSRAGGTFFAILGLIALLPGLGGESLLDRWPLLLAALLLFGAARLCFRSRRGMLDLLD